MWRRRTALVLNALDDPAATVRAVLALVPTLPAAPAETGETHSPFLRPHVHDILTGMVWCADLLPRAQSPWAGQVLEPLAVFTGTGPGGSKQLRADRYQAQVRAVRALHTPVREHPRALLDPRAPDTTCIECGRDVLTDLRRHVFDTATETWRCAARASRSPQVCPTCRDERGRRVLAPCPTAQAMHDAAP